MYSTTLGEKLAEGTRQREGKQRGKVCGRGGHCMTKHLCMCVCFDWKDYSKAKFRQKVKIRALGTWKIGSVGRLGT